MPTVMQSKISDHTQDGSRAHQRDLPVSYQRTLSFISLPEWRLEPNLSGNNSDFRKCFCISECVIA